MSVQNPVNYAELTDEAIDAIKRRIETFTKSNEHWNGLVNEEKWDRGSKTMKSRRVIKPKVREADIEKAVEHVAPRPSKIAVETFSHSVDIYRDKVKYTAEDVIYGYDDIVKICGDTLSEIVTQKLNLIKGKPFISSAATLTVVTSGGVEKYLPTLAKAAIILQKNEAKSWARGKYLAICTPELLEKIREEIEAKGSSMSEPMKEEVETGIVGGYGRWLFKEVTNDLLYKTGSKQYLVLMGRRPNGASPIDVAKIDGVTIYHNPLGSGVLLDADGNVTSDDNKQEGSIACNIDGLGAYVNDDLCILDCEVTVDEIGATVLNQAEKTGFVSSSPYANYSFAAVDSTGAAIASPTVTLKKKDSSGEAVSDLTKLVAGDTYYYSVAKANYTTVTGTFVANGGNNTITVVLAADSN